MKRKSEIAGEEEEPQSKRARIKEDIKMDGNGNDNNNSSDLPANMKDNDMINGNNDIIIFQHIDMAGLLYWSYTESRIECIIKK